MYILDVICSCAYVKFLSVICVVKHEHKGWAEKLVYYTMLRHLDKTEIS